MKVINEKNLHKATAQEVFDYVTSRLLRQGRRSESGLGMCQYRGPGGLKCAAGWLISDEFYHPCMEGKSWLGLVERFNVIDEHSQLIAELQFVHDESEPEDWVEDFNKVAQEFSLKPIEDW